MPSLQTNAKHEPSLLLLVYNLASAPERCHSKTIPQLGYGVGVRAPFQARVCSSLDLLLGADVWVVATLSLAAVGCLGWKSGVALAANHLFAFVGTSESSEGRLNLDATDTTTAQSKHQVESGLFLDVVV